MTHKRKVTRIVRGVAAMDGAGVKLRRVLGVPTIKQFDPFLMLDGFDSLNPEDYMKGFPWHPHRGIETITFLAKGQMEHGDSLGNRGTIGPRGTQWMNAGSGIIHQEMPVESEEMLGCQLWLNLPKDRKMSEPSYRDITSKDIIDIDEGDAKVGLIAGDYHGYHAHKGDHVQVTYLEVKLAPNSTWTFDEAKNDETLFTYLFKGTMAGDEALASFEEKGAAMLFTLSGDGQDENEVVTVKAGDTGAHFVLLMAKPLGEPVAWGGPVVMNTEEELNEAFAELDNGSFIKHNAR